MNGEQEEDKEEEWKEEGKRRKEKVQVLWYGHDRFAQPCRSEQDKIKHIVFNIRCTKMDSKKKRDCHPTVKGCILALTHSLPTACIFILPITKHTNQLDHDKECGPCRLERREAAWETQLPCLSYSTSRSSACIYINEFKLDDQPQVIPPSSHW